MDELPLSNVLVASEAKIIPAYEKYVTQNQLFMSISSFFIYLMKCNIICNNPINTLVTDNTVVLSICAAFNKVKWCDSKSPILTCYLLVYASIVPVSLD